MNLLTKKVTKESLFPEYTNILNGVLQLSKRESEVLSFLLLKDFLDPGNANTNKVRKELITVLNISEANLSKYLSTLKTKGLIVRGSKGWVINDIVRPVVKDGVFELKFVLEME